MPLSKGIRIRNRKCLWLTIKRMVYLCSERLEDLKDGGKTFLVKLTLVTEGKILVRASGRQGNKASRHQGVKSRPSECLSSSSMIVMAVVVVVVVVVVVEE